MSHVILPCIDCVCLASCKTKMLAGGVGERNRNQGVHTLFNPDAYDKILKKCSIIEEYIRAIEVMEAEFCREEVEDRELSEKRRFEFISFMVKGENHESYM